MEIVRWRECGAIFTEDFRCVDARYGYTNANIVKTGMGNRLYFTNGSFTKPSTVMTSYMYWFERDSYAVSEGVTYKNGELSDLVGINFTDTGFTGVTGWVSDLVIFDRALLEDEILAYSKCTTFNYYGELSKQYLLKKDQALLTYSQLDEFINTRNKRGSWANLMMLDLLKNTPGIQNFIPIRHGSGTFDIEITGMRGRHKWFFYNGESSTATREIRTVTPGTSYLVFWGSLTNVTIYDRSTASMTIETSEIPNIGYSLRIEGDSVLNGEVSNLPALEKILVVKRAELLQGYTQDIPRVTTQLTILNGLQLMGDVKDLPRVTQYLQLTNVQNLLGNTADLPKPIYTLTVTGCALLEGDISNLNTATVTVYIFNNANIFGDIGTLKPITSYLIFTRCGQVYGIVTPGTTAHTIRLSDTGLTKTDIEQSLINVDNAGTINGIFECHTNMPTIDDPVAVLARESLLSKGWTVTVKI